MTNEKQKPEVAEFDAPNGNHPLVFFTGKHACSTLHGEKQQGFV